MVDKKQIFFEKQTNAKTNKMKASAWKEIIFYVNSTGMSNAALCGVGKNVEWAGKPKRLGKEEEKLSVLLGSWQLRAVMGVIDTED